jgi:hypothetical protein
MRLLPEHVAAARRFESAFPLPKGDGSEGFLDVNYRKPPRGWTHRLAEYFCFLFGPKWGHKRRFGSSTDPNDGYGGPEGGLTEPGVVTISDATLRLPTLPMSTLEPAPRSAS